MRRSHLAFQRERTKPIHVIPFNSVIETGTAGLMSSNDNVDMRFLVAETHRVEFACVAERLWHARCPPHQANMGYHRSLGGLQ